MLIKEESQNSKEEALTTSTCHNVRFEGLGWKIRLRQRRTNYFLTLAKEIVIGNGLRKGDDLFYYLVECGGRTGILVLLDGKERGRDNSVHVRARTFNAKTKDKNFKHEQHN
mgnify:CR=1 FL=1